MYINSSSHVQIVNYYRYQASEVYNSDQSFIAGQRTETDEVTGNAFYL